MMRSDRPPSLLACLLMPLVTVQEASQSILVVSSLLIDAVHCVSRDVVDGDLRTYLASGRAYACTQTKLLTVAIGEPASETPWK